MLRMQMKILKKWDLNHLQFEFFRFTRFLLMYGVGGGDIYFHTHQFNTVISLCGGQIGHSYLI